MATTLAPEELQTKRETGEIFLKPLFGSLKETSVFFYKSQKPRFAAERISHPVS